MNDQIDALPYLKFEEGSPELTYMRERRMALGANCRQYALNHFSLEEQADRYCQLYTEILSERAIR